jgi:hypothetical protein
MFGTEQTSDISPWQISCIASLGTTGVWRLRGYRTPARERAERGAMKNERGPTTYFTIEELREIAAAKLEEASALPAGFAKEELLRSADNFRSLAELKGWLSSELRPPK